MLSRNSREMRVALPLKLKKKLNYGCRNIRGKDSDEFTINGVFKTRTAFASGILTWRCREVNDVTASRHPQLPK